MSDLSGKVCLVTGGAGHIGRAICESLLAEGAEVIAVGRREPATPSHLRVAKQPSTVQTFEIPLPPKHSLIL